MLHCASVLLDLVCLGVPSWQVDWYCCNVGPYHAMRAMDPSVEVTDDEDIKRWVVDEDAVVAKAVAKAVGGWPRVTGGAVHVEEQAVVSS